MTVNIIHYILICEYVQVVQILSIARLDDHVIHNSSTKKSKWVPCDGKARIGKFEVKSNQCNFTVACPTKNSFTSSDILKNVYMKLYYS